MKPIGKIVLQWEMKNVIFSSLSKNFYGGELPQNYFSLHEKLPDKSKFRQKNWEKIYFARNN